jgi:hypothetical protein
MRDPEKGIVRHRSAAANVTGDTNATAAET